jgi:hypothetical protein
MIARINLQAQFFFGLLVALLLGWIYQPSFAGMEPSTPPVASPIPIYENLPGGWRVEVRFYKNKPPEVLSMEPLDQIRLGGIANLGDYSISVLDEDGQELLVQKFQVYFLRTGSDRQLESVDRTFVIPHFDTATEIMIHAPTGETHYAIPEQ